MSLTRVRHFFWLPETSINSFICSELHQRQLFRAFLCENAPFFVLSAAGRRAEAGDRLFLMGRDLLERAGKNDFRYNPQKDSYTCPAGAELTLRRCMDREGSVTRNYNNPNACGQCPLKPRCTESGYRTVSRSEYEDNLTRMAATVAATPEKIGLRKTIIEHVWGTLKWPLPGGFVLKGLKRVQAEVSLAHFSYNLKRARAVIGLQKLLQACH